MAQTASKTLVILETAETIARVHGDTETAQRLVELAAEVREAEEVTETSTRLPICSVCGGDVGVAPSVQCKSCGFLFQQ